ncbi:MAG: peptidyl-prolyl cis-trans isomerase [Sphingopyxis sp.]
MITAIRRMITSKVGAVVALVFLAIVGLAFAMSDINGTSNASGGAVAADSVASVGKRQITLAYLRQRLDRAYANAARQQPGLTMQQFVASGGLDRLVKETTDIVALEQYARAHGVSVDKVAIDAVITRNPAFAGLNGSFSQAAYEAALQREGTTDAQLRADLTTESIVRQLIAPVGSIDAVPNGVATPYASLLLEQRQGQATFISAAQLAPTAAPTAAQLSAYYASQRARYTIPERRALRYALLDESAVRTPPAVTPAEVAAEYQAQAATYAASESRNFAQVIAGSRAVADRIAAAVRGGATLANAARTAGLTAAPVNAASEAQYAGATSPAVARAAFAASRGGVVGPLQVPLGFVIVQVNSVDARPARSLAQATGEITATLTARKKQEAMISLFNQVQDALNNGATVAEVATDKGLRVVTTPPLLPNGTAPGNSAYRPDPLMANLLSAAFSAGEGDHGQVITLQENRVFALVEVAQTLPAAPPPLAQVSEAITRDWRLAEGAKLARARARTILAAVERGQSLSAAAAGHGGNVQSIGGRRINLSNREQRVPAEIALLFSMPQGSAKTLELPGNAGWMVIHLNRVERGDATAQPQLIEAVRQQFRDALGAEYVGTMVAAARRAFPVTTNDAAIRTLRNQLAGLADEPAN